ncbi:hypothetical protein DPMN_067874 [Dreissena polymorpha]|uniref:Uncharacterized protein n=1 Tax=Dreissena polymorpha TaxID=45954 RepID=A0A9D4BTS6_DREPO|nr:hypothetical protein DPMN_067874 [Dreissena polymorpha]
MPSKIFRSRMSWDDGSQSGIPFTMPPLPPFERRRKRILTGLTPTSKNLNLSLLPSAQLFSPTESHHARRRSQL